MRRFTGIISDLDGVLVLTEHINIEALVTVMRHRGMPLTNQEAMTIPGCSYADVTPTLFKARGIPLEEHAVILRETRALYDELWDKGVRLAPSAGDFLLSVRREKIPIALVTSNRRSVVEKFIKRFHLEKTFTAIITAEDVIHRKPFPEPYVKAMEVLGVPGEDILVLEDTLIGLRSAKSAGLACAVIPNGFSANGNFSRADYVLPSLSRVLPLLGIEWRHSQAS